MTIGSKYKVLDPVSQPVLEGATQAPRLDTLNGKVVGLYSNNKPNATKLLDMVSAILNERFDIKGTVWSSDNGSKVMRPDEWKDVERCDAIILTNGD